MVRKTPQEGGKIGAGGDHLPSKPLFDKVGHPKPSSSIPGETDVLIKAAVASADQNHIPSPSPSPIPPTQVRHFDASPQLEEPEPQLVTVEAILESNHTPQELKPRLIALVDSGASLSLIRRSKVPNHIIERAFTYKRRITGFDNLTPEVVSTHTVELRMTISGVTVDVRAAVVDNLCVDLLIGTPDIMKNNMVIVGNPNRMSLTIHGNSVRLIESDEHLFQVKASVALTVLPNTTQLCPVQLKEIPIRHLGKASKVPPTLLEVAGKDILAIAHPQHRFDNLPTRHTVSADGSFKTFLFNRHDSATTHIKAGDIVGYASYLPNQSRFTDRPLHDFVGVTMQSKAKIKADTYRLPREQPFQNPIHTVTTTTTVFSERLGSVDLSALSPRQKEEVHKLLAEYDTVLVDSLEEGGAANVPAYSMELSSDKPIKLRPRHLNPTKAFQVEEEIISMISRGIVTEHTGPWAAPVTMVRKKDGSWRFCVDYRLLNDITIADAHPLPRIDTIIESLHGARLFTVLDLASGYWQIPMDEKSREYASFVTQHGQYAPKVLPFGLKNAPSAFQRAMNHILKDHLGKICHVYIDDILIFSKTYEEHLAHVRIILDTLKAANLRAKLSKCDWFQKDVEYLGFRLTGDGILPQDTKAQAIRDAAPPANRKEIRSFMGLANYYRRFVKNFAQIAKPINDLLKNDVPFQWDVAQQQAFDSIKQHLTNAIQLAFPSYGKDIPFYLDTDASNDGQGAVLSQIIDDVERPLACWSSGWKTKDQMGYPAIDKELYTIMRALTHFRYMIEGAKTIVRTDHQPLKPMIEREELPPNALHARWISKIRSYDISVLYRPGRKNGNADGFSRHPVVPHKPQSSSLLQPTSLNDAAVHDDCSSGTSRSLSNPNLDDLGQAPLESKWDPPLKPFISLSGENGQVHDTEANSSTQITIATCGVDAFDSSTEAYSFPFEPSEASLMSLTDYADLISGEIIPYYDYAKVDTTRKILCLHCASPTATNNDNARVAPVMSPSSTQSFSSSMDVDSLPSSSDDSQPSSWEIEDIAFRSAMICTSIVCKATRDARLMVEGGHWNMKEWQEKDEFIMKLRKLVQRSSDEASSSNTTAKTDSITHNKDKWHRWLPFLTLSQDILRYKNRVVLPEKMRELIITEYHSFLLHGGHSGRAATYHKIYAKYWWPSMRKQIYAFVDSCMSCQTIKPRTHVPFGLLQPLPPTSRLFQRVGIDFVGPITPSLNNNRHILVLVDYYTHWAEAFPLPEQTSERIVNVFIEHIIPRFGCPEELLSDRGANFLSNLSHQLYTAMRTKKLSTTAYHPQTNGLTERTNGIIKMVLTHFVGLNKATWEEYLPFVLYSYRVTPTPALGGLSPFTLLYGQEPRHPLDRLTVDLDLNPENTSDGILNDVHRRMVEHREQIAKFRLHARDVVRKRTEEKQENMKRLADTKRKEHTFKVGESVFQRIPTGALGTNSLERRYRGPYKIIGQAGDSNLNFRLFDPIKNKERIVHVSTLIHAKSSKYKRPTAYLQLPFEKDKGIPIEQLKEGAKVNFPWRDTPTFDKQNFDSLQRRSSKLPHLQYLWSQLYNLLQFCENPPAMVYQPIDTVNLHFDDIMRDIQELIYDKDLPRILDSWEMANQQTLHNRDLHNHAGLLRYWLHNTSQFRVRRPSQE